MGMGIEPTALAITQSLTDVHTHRLLGRRTNLRLALASVTERLSDPEREVRLAAAEAMGAISLMAAAHYREAEAGAETRTAEADADAEVDVEGDSGSSGG